MNIPDPTRHVLSIVFRKYRPELWFAGHFHRRIRGDHEGCPWTSLADSCLVEEEKAGWMVWLRFY